MDLYIKDFNETFLHDEDYNLQVNTEIVNNFIEKHMLVLVLLGDYQPSDLKFIKRCGSNRDKYGVCLSIKERITKALFLIKTQDK